MSYIELLTSKSKSCAMITPSVTFCYPMQCLNRKKLKNLYTLKIAHSLQTPWQVYKNICDMPTTLSRSHCQNNMIYYSRCT